MGNYLNYFFLGKIFTVILIVILVLPAIMLFQVKFVTPIRSSHNPSDFNLSYTREEFKTEDDITLVGWFIPKEGIDAELASQYPTLIFLHGWPADKGDILPIFVSFAKDYNLFFFDFRGLGESQKTLSTVGVREKKDLVAALDFLEEKYDIKEVGLWGFSMGGAVALMVSSEDARIKATASDSSYASLFDMTYALYKIPVFRYPLGITTVLYARLFFGVDVNQARQEKTAGKIEIPIFLIHSKDDKVIDFSHGERLKKAFRDKENLEVWFTERGHGMLDINYESRIKSFFDKHL